MTTSLDLGYQAAAEAAVESLPTPGDPGAALVAIDPATGHVLAMAGGRDFATSQLNLATFRGGTGRQAGSAFKAFTLAEAMDQGFRLDSRWYGPNTIHRRPDVRGSDGEPWQPENAEGGGLVHAAVGDGAFGEHRVRAARRGAGTRQRRGHGARLGIDRPAGGVRVTLGSVAVNPSR